MILVIEKSIFVFYIEYVVNIVVNNNVLNIMIIRIFYGWFVLINRKNNVFSGCGYV